MLYQNNYFIITFCIIKWLTWLIFNQLSSCGNQSCINLNKLLSNIWTHNWSHTIVHQRDCYNYKWTLILWTRVFEYFISQNAWLWFLCFIKPYSNIKTYIVPCIFCSFMGHHGKSLHTTEIQSFSRDTWRREQSCGSVRND